MYSFTKTPQDMYWQMPYLGLVNHLKCLKVVEHSKPTMEFNDFKTLSSTDNP